jgi:hypothetical protein
LGTRWASAEGLLDQELRALEAKAWEFINALEQHAVILREFLLEEEPGLNLKDVAELKRVIRQTLSRAVRRGGLANPGGAITG